MTATDPTLDTCNTLLIGEMAAVETYSQLIDKFDAEGSDVALERIRSHHQENVFELQMLIADGHAEPAASLGTWPGFDEALQQSEVLVGESPVLKILQACEALVVSQYKNALASEEVSDAAKAVIKHRLLPVLAGHLIDLQQRRDQAQ